MKAFYDCGSFRGSKALHWNIVETYFEEGMCLCVHRWPRSFIQGQKKDEGSGWEIKVFGVFLFWGVCNYLVKLGWIIR